MKYIIFLTLFISGCISSPDTLPMPEEREKTIVKSGDVSINAFPKSRSRLEFEKTIWTNYDPNTDEQPEYEVMVDGVYIPADCEAFKMSINVVLVDPDILCKQYPEYTRVRVLIIRNEY